MYTSFEEAAQAVVRDGLNFGNCSEVLRDDDAIVDMAKGQNPQAFEYASLRIRAAAGTEE